MSFQHCRKIFSFQRSQSMILVKNSIIGDQLEGLCAFFNILIDTDCPYYEEVSYKVLFSLVGSARGPPLYTFIHHSGKKRYSDFLLTNGTHFIYVA